MAFKGSPCKFSSTKELPWLKSPAPSPRGSHSDTEERHSGSLTLGPSLLPSPPALLPLPLFLSCCTPRTHSPTPSVTHVSQPHS